MTKQLASSCSTWNNPAPAYDLVVVGAGHAGIEAALAGSRMGLRTLIVTMSLQSIGQMSCNPAIGGLGKGHLVKEIDALGGEMARAIDQTGIQFRMLNRSKGPAVWSPRAQADKTGYAAHMMAALDSASGLDQRQGMVSDLVVDEGRITHVELSTGTRIRGHAFVLCAGTFLNGCLHHGERRDAGGRAGEPAATGLSEALARQGIAVSRYKTGTPPRVDSRSIDFSKMDVQPGDPEPSPFRHYENLIHGEQLSCFISYTNEQTHDLLRANLDRAPMFSGQIDSTGPRYCPSVEDKVVRFADKDRHQIFLEPEGRATREMYVNGFSTSMPEEVQVAALRTVPGFEQVRLIRPGYAIEYDYFPAWQMDVRLQVRGFENLFFAGQINGTSGYEEAGIQGLLAAVNAAALLDPGREPLVIRRDEGYAGVLVDDLVNRPSHEPYRMFTSRSEFRLLLRQDNADERLMPLARKHGLLEEWRWEKLQQRMEHKRGLKNWLTATRIGEQALTAALPSTHPFAGKGGNDQSRLAADWLRRPELRIADLLAVGGPAWWREVDESLLLAVELDIKYAGYIDRQHRAMANFRKSENMVIPEELDFHRLSSLSTEARERFSQVRPRSLGQASRVSGVRHSDLQALWVVLQQRRP